MLQRHWANAGNTGDVINALKRPMVAAVSNDPLCHRRANARQKGKFLNRSGIDVEAKLNRGVWGLSEVDKRDLPKRVPADERQQDIGGGIISSTGILSERN